MTKQSGFLLFIVGALVIATVYSIMQLNKVQKALPKGTNNTSGRMLEANPVPEVDAVETPKAPAPASSVSASDLANAVREEMSKGSKINVTFNA